MPIDIDPLTEAELIDLNHRIVERLNMLKQLRAHSAMLAFKIGDRVRFRTDTGEMVTGMLVRYNKKTVTVVEERGRRWTVSPGFLQKVGSLRLESGVKKTIPLLKDREKPKKNR
jgi:ribosomal protein L21E